MSPSLITGFPSLKDLNVELDVTYIRINHHVLSGFSEVAPKFRYHKAGGKSRVSSFIALI